MSRHCEAFKGFKRRAKEELGDSLKKLILYGSVVRGEEDQDSDVDVFAVVEGGEQKRFLEDLGAEVGVENGVLLVPIVRTSREYEEIKDTIHGKEVRSKGVSYV